MGIKKSNNHTHAAKNGKRRIWPIITVCVVIIVIMAGVTVYPLISNYLEEKNASKVITTYDDSVDTHSNEELEAMLQEARDYNKTLIPSVVQDGETYTEEYLQAAAESYNDILNLNEFGMMGYVEIPKIDVYLPIYHGTDTDVLNLGAGHVLGTSLPVGGESTHSVISAHSGMSSQKMFSDLEDLEEGDVFYIHILRETLAYEVREISIVLPEEVDELQIELGEDKVTLITCYPFGVNTHRLLVTGYRIPYEEAVIEQEAEESESNSINKWLQEYLKGILIGVSIPIVIIGCWLLFNFLKKKKQQKKLDGTTAGTIPQVPEGEDQKGEREEESTEEEEEGGGGD